MWRNYRTLSVLCIALKMPVAMASVALFAFRTVKGHFTGANKRKWASQTFLAGGLAAGAAFALAHAPG